MFFESSCDFVRDLVRRRGGEIFLPCPRCGGVPAFVVSRRDDFDGAFLVFCARHPDRSFQTNGKDLLTVFDRTVRRWNNFAAAARK